MLIFKQISEGGEGMRQCLKEEHARQGIQQKLWDWNISGIFLNNGVTMDSGVE